MKVYSSLMLIRQTPMTAQFVVMRGRKIPRPAYSAGMLFLRNNSTNCTREAITRMKAKVLKNSNPKGWSKTRLVTHVMAPAMTSTKTTAMAMPTAVSIFFEVPKNGQFPRYCISKILFTKIQLIKSKI